MTSFRLWRSSLVHHFFSRGLCTEHAVAATRPPKIALRTSKDDPTSHANEDIGKLYTMPEEVKKRLFHKFDLPEDFRLLSETLLETNIVIRQPALEIIDYMKRANYSHPIIRYLIYGKYGCGKTLTLIHAMNYAVNNNFIVVYVPKVWEWFHYSKEVVSPEEDPSIFDLPVDAGAWLKKFENTNSALISKLDLKVSQTYEWNQREKTEEGAPLNELVSHGIIRVKYACRVIDALLNELKIHSRNNRCKTFVGIDGFNGFLQTSSRLKTAEHVPLIPTKASLTKSFLSFIRNDWNNGAAVLVVDDQACVEGKFSSHFPFHLLQKVGVELIDPFIPVHVPNYTPVEFQNYLDYLEEMRWLQKPDGRDEIDFVTTRNPNLVNIYCATR